MSPRAEIMPLDARAARLAALDALARRDYASGDLRAKLIKKGYDAAVVDLVLERLVAEKLLDDDRYVESFLAYHAARGQGPMRVRADLKKLGLQGLEVEAALQAYPDWLLHLRAANLKKFGATPSTQYADRQRQARFLSYRGYTGAQIRIVLGVDTDLGFETEMGIVGNE